ncbi:MAG: hydroxymethylbilane synthase [Huintestinicola sp.]
MTLKIGTRKSRLAVRQAEMAAAAIKEKYPGTETELVYITTEGDRVTDKPLSAMGGKGVFVSEIENALIEGRIDIAVHSAKDMSVNCAEGLAVTGVLNRDDPCDLLIFRRDKTSFSGSFTVGTGSLRRRMGIEKMFPDAVFSDIRGNIDTRLNKLRNGEYDSIMLAAAGIDRLDLDMSEFHIMRCNDIIPAPCQAMIALETKAEGYAAGIARAVSHEETYICFETERYSMKLLGADCTLPIGAYSYVNDGKITLFLSKDGKKITSGYDDINIRFALAERLVNSL